MVGEFKTIPGRFKQNLDALKDSSLFPEVELSEGAANLGEAIGQAFADGFAETTGAEDLVNRLFDGAERRAAERAAKEAGQAAGGAGEGTGGGAPGGLPEEGLDQTLSEFDKLLKNMILENDLLERLTTKRGAAGEALKAEAEAEIFFTDEERKLVELQKEENMLLREKNAILNELNGPQEQLKVTIEALNQLRADGLITQEQYNQKLREMKIAADQASNSIGAGLSRGLEQIKSEIEDVGSLMEDTLVNAFHSAEDALVTFVRTGQFNFKEFANSLLDDITRLIVRLLVLQTIQAITGTSGGGLGAAARQAGGPVQANRPFLVGEKGPELFVPQGMGNIVPADETASATAAGAQAASPTVVQAPAPQVNVQVVNVSDPNEVPTAMDSPAGDQTIMNSVSRNKDQFRRLLQ
jgi:hypothetical protein